METEQSWLEKVASNPLTKAAATTGAAFGSTVVPLAVFLPLLVDSLASGRQAKRLEAMFGDLQQLIEENSDKIKNMTDDQYKVVNEAISAAFYTINQEKLELLKRAAINATHDSESVKNVSDSLSRLIRDISPAEATFVIKNFSYEYFEVASEVGWSDKAVAIKPNSDDEIVLSGLINIGLLYPKTSRADVIAYEWSPLAVKLISLIRA